VTTNTLAGLAFRSSDGGGGGAIGDEAEEGEGEGEEMRSTLGNTDVPIETGGGSAGWNGGDAAAEKEELEEANAIVARVVSTGLLVPDPG
jgi:hypothetical protein